jgi:hypothetical protein
MVDRNTNWEYIALNLLELYKANKANICKFADRINNAIHNTGSSVLDKLSTGRSKLGMTPFLRAFDIVHKSRLPNGYAQYVSPEVRRLVKTWYGVS